MERINDKGKVSVWNILKFGGAFVGLMIGAGYASGQETLQFYGGYGLWGILGMLIQLGLYIWLIPTLLGFGYDTKTGMPERGKYRWYCGKYIGTFFDIFVPIYLIGVMSIMIAGGSTILLDYFGVPRMIGAALISIVVMFTYLAGSNKLISIVGSCGIFIIVFLFIVIAYGIISGPDLADANELVAEYDVAVGAPTWWIAPFISISYCVSTSVPFFISIGADAQSRREATHGGLCGAIMMGGIGVLFLTALLANIDAVHDAEIPTLVLASSLHPIFGKLYAVLILLGMYSTATPMMQMSCDAVPVKNKSQKLVVAIIAAIIGTIVGQSTFSELINALYPVTGWIGLIFLICLLVKQIMLHREKKAALAGAAPAAPATEPAKAEAAAEEEK